MRCQSAARFRAADEAVENAVWETRLGAKGREEEGGERVELGGLNDDGVAACEGGCDFLGEARDGRVEGDDAGCYAPGLAERVLSCVRGSDGRRGRGPPTAMVLSWCSITSLLNVPTIPA